jgi:hypothetical protein
LTLKDKTIVNKDSDIFITIVEHYSANKLGEEEELDKEEEVKKVTDAKALISIKRVKLWKL